MTEHPLDDLAAYALGALEADEQRAVSAHLDGCPTCRAEAGALAGTVWTIAETAGRTTPGRLRGAIVARARRDGATPAPARVGVPFWSGLFRPVPLLAPLALAAVLVLALAGYAGARRDADRYLTAVSSAVGAKVVPLAATGAAVSGMRGSLVVPTNGTKPYLILDLPAAPAGKTWEAWVIHGDVAARAGIADDRGITTLELGAPLGPGDTVAITAEPTGGLDRPTGPPVLAAKA